MATKPHTPQAWDLYRTQNGDWYLIVRVDAGYLKILDSDGELCEAECFEAGPDEFAGNLLALPDLLRALGEIATSVTFVLSCKQCPAKMKPGLQAIVDVAQSAIDKTMTQKET